MAEIEFIPMNLSTGYGMKKLQLTQNGTTQNLNYQGAILSGDLALGVTVKADAMGECLATAEDKKDCEDVKKEGPARVKAGLDIVTAKADAMFGQANDNYIRFALNLGPHYRADAQGDQAIRFVWESGVTGRWETTRTALPEGQNVTGNNWSVDFPLAFGLGAKNVFVLDKLNLMIEFTPSFKMRNEASISYRFYGNYYNKYLQTVDVAVGNVYEKGKINDGTRENNTLWFASLNLGLFGLSIKSE